MTRCAPTLESRADITGAQHIDAGQLLAHDLGGALFVARIDDRPQIGYRHRLDTVGAEAPRRAADGLFVERQHLGAVRANTLGNAQAQIARHKVLGFLEMDVEPFGLSAPAQVHDVAEALGAQQADDRTVALDQGIGRHGLAVNQKLRLAQKLCDRGSGLLGQPAEAPRNGQQGLVGRRVFLVDVEPAVVAQQDHVGEGAADIDADSMPHVYVSCGAGLKFRAMVGASR